MKNIFLAFMAIATLLLSNCKKDPKGTVVDIDVNIAYKNSLDEDLLDVNVQNHFSSSNIHVYNVKNGISIERYYPNYDNPRMWEIRRQSPTSISYLIVGI